MTEREIKRRIRAEAEGFGKFSERWSRIEGRLEASDGQNSSAKMICGGAGRGSLRAAVRRLIARQVKFFKIFLCRLRKIGHRSSS